MRRSVLAFAGTALGITLMVGAKLTHADLTGADVVSEAPLAEDGTPTDPASPAVQEGISSSPKARASAAASPGPKASTRPGPSAPPSTAKPAARYKDGTFTGPAVKERYGSITVTVVVSGGAITKASATCACSGQSLTISTRAFNGTSTRKGLNPSTLTAQSASISTFSGATYTSTAYKQSLASALAKAKP